MTGLCSIRMVHAQQTSLRVKLTQRRSSGAAPHIACRKFLPLNTCRRIAVVFVFGRHISSARLANDLAHLTSPAACRLEGVLKNYMVDFAERMHTIQGSLEECASAPEATEQQVALAEKHLEELMDIVESIDFARDLRSIGGLPVLKALMTSAHPSLRWRAADVVATCAQNNPPVQVRGSTTAAPTARTAE